MIEKIDNAIEFAKSNIPEHYELIKEALENKKSKEIHKKISQYANLKNENVNLKRKYQELETRATKITPAYAETTGGAIGTNEGKVAIAGEMAELAKQINENIALTNNEITQIEKLLAGIKDTEVREIIRYKFEDGLTWQQVAFKIGAYNESYPRMKYNRWLNNF